MKRRDPDRRLGRRRRAIARRRPARRLPDQQLERARARQPRPARRGRRRGRARRSRHEKKPAAALIRPVRRQSARAPGHRCWRARGRRSSEGVARRTSKSSTPRPPTSRRLMVVWHRDAFDFDGCDEEEADGMRSPARASWPRISTRPIPVPRGLPGRLTRASAVVKRHCARPRSQPKHHIRWHAQLRPLHCPVVMIGDRPSTDGAFATQLGVPFALVLSGVAGTAGEEPVPDPPPAFVAVFWPSSRRC